MTELLEKAKTYYDGQIARKLRDFVEGNERVELAWQTIEQWAPPDPRRILEIGCGIGDISWRMTRRWPECEVVGLEISRKSLEIAEKLFRCLAHGNDTVGFVVPKVFVHPLWVAQLL